MTARGMTSSEQAREWLQVGQSFAEPTWMQLCMQQAEQMADLVVREREVLAKLSDGVNSAPVKQPYILANDLPAERQFIWLGDRENIVVGALRDGIEALANNGYLSLDLDQRSAMRRAMGVCINASERNTRGPWVRWTGEADALNYLVDSLWQLGIIYCQGGRRYKWQTLCGAFLHADGRRFEPTIKNNRCSNKQKIKTIDESIINPLKFLMNKS